MNDYDLLPQSPEAERGLLGAILIDQSILTEINQRLTPDMFLSETHRTIAAAILDLNRRNIPVDFVTLGDELDAKRQLKEVGGPAYLTHLASSTPWAMNWQNYLDILAAKAYRRTLIDRAAKLAKAAYDETTDKTELEALTASLSTPPETTSALTHIRPELQDTIDRLDYMERNPDAIPGLPTTWSQLDWILNGLGKGHFIIAAGRPAMGKTSFALNMMTNQATRWPGIKLAYFSLEMSKQELIQRIVAMQSGITSTQLRIGKLNPEDWTKLLDTANKLAETGIYINDTPGLTVTAMLNHCKVLKARDGLDAVYIDYIQLMISGKAREENRQQEITRISRELKQMARILDVPVIALSQLNRGVEARADKRPMLSDLRESGSLEQDADVVLFLYREDYYDPNTPDQNVTEIAIGKHRHGAIGKVKLYFRKETQSFEQLETIRVPLPQP